MLLRLPHYVLLACGAMREASTFVEASQVDGVRRRQGERLRVRKSEAQTHPLSDVSLGQAREKARSHICRCSAANTSASDGMTPLVASSFAWLQVVLKAAVGELGSG